MSASSLVEWVEEGACRTHPEKRAVLGERGSLAWGDLLRGAHAISAFLRDAGLGRGDRIGLWMEKSPAAVQALLGILGAGAAYVPLDPRSAVGRTALIARDGGLAALFADEPGRRELAAVVRESGVGLAVVDADELAPWEEAALTGSARVALLSDVLGFPPSEPARPGPDELACVLHASGAAGPPGGVAHTHAAALSLARGICDRFAVHSDDVFVGQAPLHSDLSIPDLFASLGTGASLRLLSPAEAMLPPYLVRMLDVWGVTVWCSVPSALVALLEQGGIEARPPVGLRLVLVEGEVLPAVQLQRLRRALPAVTVANLSGATGADACIDETLRP